MTTLRHLLAIEPGVIPDTVRLRLAERWGTKNAFEIGAMSANEIEEELAAIMPDPEFDSLARLTTAKALHRFVRTLGYSPENSPLPELNPSRGMLDGISLSTLLTTLILAPAGRDNLVTAINERPEIQAIEPKTQGRWVVPGSEVSISVGETLGYVAKMMHSHTLPQRMVNGVRPITLNQAVGIDSRALIHFFTGESVTGTDRHGYDFDMLNPELHTALIWAALTSHRAISQDVEWNVYLEQIFTKGAVGRWAVILDDYREAVANGDETARGASRYWPMALPLNEIINFKIGITRSVEQALRRRRGPIDHEKVVREAAAKAGTLTGGSSQNYRPNVYDRIEIRGMGNNFDGVALINGGIIEGNGNSGYLLLPHDPSVNVAIKGSNTVTIARMSWDELAESLHLT